MTDVYRELIDRRALAENNDFRKELEGSRASRISSESKQIRSGFVVLEKGKEIEGETKTVHAPASTLIPANTRHSIKNKSEGPLKYVYVYVMGLDAAWIS